MPAPPVCSDTEITSGLYYGYVVVDVPQLVMNLTGHERSQWLESDRALSGKVVEHLIHLIAKVSPGAKLGSTAPYSHAEFMLIEIGKRQPRTLANAFRDPVPITAKDGLGLGRRTANSLGSYLAAMEKLYGAHETRLQAALPELALDGVQAMSLPELASTVSAAIVAGTS